MSRLRMGTTTGTSPLIVTGVLYVIKHRLIVYKKACLMTSFLTFSFGVSVVQDKIVGHVDSVVLQEPFLFLPRLVFKMVFCTESGMFAGEFLMVNQSEGVAAPHPGVLGSLISLVLVKASLDIISKAAVKAVVGTVQDIDIIRFILCHIKASSLPEGIPHRPR